MKDVTVEIKEVIEKLEKIGQTNDYSLQADKKEVDKLKHILNNLFYK